ncbi:metallophosphoesterase [Variovorax sp. RTB1]|uniref:metallophosphoesterase n=1 Tax=Variovorax sp. RTB1 TaxID=3048631 RepID=UPI002B22F6B7|nr:metallophosphoesterase [Variovorax sp. RTB1]MEB0114560.1 metallophosphoesterase [Variovorax sp. RTB1]
MFKRPSSSRQGPLLFTFVVVADTHVNESGDVSSSPFHTNQLANERARHVFQDIAAMTPAPAFVVHLGDIVHPVPSLPTFADAVAQFKDITSALAIPLHLVPGNHDVGDKRIDWMPADQVCAAYIDIYREAFGADYHAFDRGELRFIFLNSLLLNSGLAEEAVQRQWFEAEMDRAGGKRIFLFMHYPPFIYKEDERGNYDNIDEPARSWLVGQMKRPAVEGVFAGHVHNFWYDRTNQAEFYMLPSTAFLRHDFTEFYKVSAGYEFGRGDVEKFGYFVVDVYESGHVAYAVRTMGRQTAQGQQQAAIPTRYLSHPKTSTFDRVGVELRHPWAESMQITATGGVQEFGRKWARNDYPLMALWEMGARLSKVPDIDLAEHESRERMRLMARLGHRYIVTTLKLPQEETTVDSGMQDCGVYALEINITLSNFARQKEAWKSYRRHTGHSLYLSKILTYDGSNYDGKHFSHFVKAGFALDELEGSAEFLTDGRKAGEFDGITVRIEADQDLASCMPQLTAFRQRTGCLILASLKLADKSLAVARIDDRANAAKVVQSMALSKASDGIAFVFDTFMDVDRGYFPRNAFIDRRFNPRPAAQAFTMMSALFSDFEVLPMHGFGTTRAGSISFSAGAANFVLLCETAETVESYLERTAHSELYDLVECCTCLTANAIADFHTRLMAKPRPQLQVLLIRTS